VSFGLSQAFARLALLMPGAWLY